MKQATSGRRRAKVAMAAARVLAIFSGSRMESMHCAQKGLPFCWTDFFDQALAFGEQELIGEIWLWKDALFNTLLRNMQQPDELFYR